MALCRATGVQIHPTAVVDPTAFVDENVEIGPHAIVGAGACIGDGPISFIAASTRGICAAARNRAVIGQPEPEQA